jgi:hypothetical protein
VQQAGLFSRIVSIGKRKIVSDNVSSLVGRNVPDLFNHSAVLTSVSGGCLFLENTSVQGTIVLHHDLVTSKPHGRRPLPGYEKKCKQSLFKKCGSIQSTFTVESGRWQKPIRC